MVSISSKKTLSQLGGMVVSPADINFQKSFIGWDFQINHSPTKIPKFSSTFSVCNALVCNIF